MPKKVTVIFERNYATPLTICIDSERGKWVRKQTTADLLPNIVKWWIWLVIFWTFESLNWMFWEYYLGSEKLIFLSIEPSKSSNKIKPLIQKSTSHCKRCRFSHPFKEMKALKFGQHRINHIFKNMGVFFLTIISEIVQNWTEINKVLLNNNNKTWTK